MPDLSNSEISVEGEYGYCLMCGDLFHWEQLTNTEAGSYCDSDKDICVCLAPDLYCEVHNS